MREMLFRGKRTDTKEWIFGCLVNDIGGGVCIMPSPWFSTVIMEDDEITYDIKRDGRAIGGCFSVDPKTVGQFTGLKDSKGAKIFEGDIIRCGTVGQIKFLDGRFIYDYSHPEDPEQLDVIEIVNGEIIGNVYQNKAS